MTCFKVFDADFDTDDEIGRARINLKDIGDDWQESLKWNHVPTGRLNIHMQKMYSLSEEESHNKGSIRLLQFYIASVEFK